MSMLSLVSGFGVLKFAYFLWKSPREHPEGYSSDPV